MSQSALLGKLTSWYESHCDGDWEHQHGISLSTLDNPGWKLSVDVAGTELEHRAFETQVKNDSDADWYTCRREGDRFLAYCSVNRLQFMLETFIDWASST